MSISSITRGAQKDIRESLAALQKRFEEAADALEPGCDPDAISSAATSIRHEANEAIDSIEELQGLLTEHLADARRIEEKAEKLGDDADARYYGIEVNAEA